VAGETVAQIGLDARCVKLVDVRGVRFCGHQSIVTVTTVVGTRLEGRGVGVLVATAA
jgi:hypothetical protein